LTYGRDQSFSIMVSRTAFSANGPKSATGVRE
jgi:hypothetical protein